MTRERKAFSTRRFLVGKAGPFPRLVFGEEVMLRLDQFAYLRAKGEHGGFLIGRKRELKSAEQYEIFVERFVPIPQRDDAARLVINQGHLDTVQRALKDGDKGEEIVGWAHTHPGFGVFLSNFDKEQHQRFFPEPWQVAYVMDNLAHERAVYYHSEGEWQQLEGYYILREMGEGEIAIAGSASAVELRWGRLALLAGLLLLLIGAGSWGYSLLRPFILPKTQESITTEVPSIEQPPVVSVKAVQQEPIPQESSVRDIPPAAQMEKEMAEYGEYVVQRGDNLWKIADKLWGDPKLFSIIAEANNITNPGMIPVGKVLRIPPRPAEKNK